MPDLLRSPPAKRTRYARCLHAAALAAMLAAMAASASAQVYKCVDGKGHTTYQQMPCAGGQRGGTVELPEPVSAVPGALSSDKAEAVWQAAARERRAVVGMPKPFVTQGLGTPAEIRPPRSGETGSEVWVYPRGAQVTRVGFQDNAVAWIRSDALPPPRPPGAPTLATPEPAAEREQRVREALVVGKTCTAALQDAGPPDREETLSVGPGTGVGARYIYTFDPANANAYAAFVCLNGRVTSVERYLPAAR